MEMSTELSRMQSAYRTEVDEVQRALLYSDIRDFQDALAWLVSEIVDGDRIAERRSARHSPVAARGR